MLRPSVAAGGYLGVLPWEGGPVVASTLGLQVDNMPWLRMGFEARLSSPFQLITGLAEYAELAFTLGMTYDFDFGSFSLHPLGAIHAGGNLGWGLTLNEPSAIVYPAFGFALGGMVSLPNGLQVTLLAHYPATPMVLNEPDHLLPEETYVASRAYVTARVGWMWEFPFGS